DRKRYPVMIGSLAPAGALQLAMHSLSTPNYSLNATKRRQYPSAIHRLKKLIRAEDISIVHAHCFDPTFIGGRAARSAGVKFVFTRHHSDHNIRLGKKWHTRIDSFCARHADHVIAVSEATRRIMVDVEGVPDRQITVVYNGMEPLRAADPGAVLRLREEFGLGDAPVALMIGRLHEEKGHRYLFDALAQLNQRGSRLTVMLAGDGPQRAVIEAEAIRADVSDQIRFLGRRPDIPELIALSSVVVLPSLAESFGFAALEAMSLAKPVVAFDTGGLPEVIGDGGLLVPQGDSTELAEAIAAVWANPELAQRLGAAGRARVGQFTFDKMITGYEQVYDRVLAR
ncbi:MAG: glycosyltransferase family 4 protein, partial [Pyrinomonadaceae bacterium]